MYPYSAASCPKSALLPPPVGWTRRCGTRSLALLTAQIRKLIEVLKALGTKGPGGQVSVTFGALFRHTVDSFEVSSRYIYIYNTYYIYIYIYNIIYILYILYI